MNRLAYIRAITLIGKIASKMDLSPLNLSIEDQELVRQCLEEHKFYHTPTVVQVAAGAIGKPGRPPKGV